MNARDPRTRRDERAHEAQVVPIGCPGYAHVTPGGARCLELGIDDHVEDGWFVGPAATLLGSPSRHNAPMPYDLSRFLVAQQDVYVAVLSELRRGRKESHWIWFIFPQLAGLGHSAESQRFAIASLDEARGYLAHPVLGARLRECARALLAITGRTANEILGPIDAMKLRSCMTLFHRAAPDEPVFMQVLDRFYGGVADEATDTRLG